MHISKFRKINYDMINVLITIIKRNTRAITFQRNSLTNTHTAMKK